MNKRVKSNEKFTKINIIYRCIGHNSNFKCVLIYFLI